MNTGQVQDSRVLQETCVCPWQIVHIFDNFLRPLIHNPRKLFEPYVRPGMTVLDIGCGRGFASIGLAKLVGDSGLVISADLQPEMLDMVKERAEKTGLANRIRFHLCQANHIGVLDELDFVVAFFMVHEVPDRRGFLEEVFALLRPGGRLFIAEPKIHVSRRDFQLTVQEAETIGFKIHKWTAVIIGRAVVLVKPDIESQ